MVSIYPIFTVPAGQFSGGLGRGTGRIFFRSRPANVSATGLSMAAEGFPTMVVRLVAMHGLPVAY